MTTPDVDLRQLMSSTASTKRNPAVSGSQRAAAVANLTGLRCTPLIPVSTDVLARIGTDAPYNLYECYVLGAQDIVEGDILTIGGTDYPVRWAQAWTGVGPLSSYVHLAVEKVRR